ncbi:28229_t:CDS:1, partial [Dentiscutata erythropus]
IDSKIGKTISPSNTSSSISITTSNPQPTSNFPPKISSRI